MAEEKDISGLEFTVNKKDTEGGIKLVEDEWLPTILTQFVPFENQWGKQLRWMFELQGSDFTWKSKDGKTGQFKVSGNTSYACSPKAKLYKWYSKIVGKEPAEGEKISLKSIIGIPCYVMLKLKVGKDKEGEPKDYYNVDKVKIRIPVQAVPPTSTPTPVAPTVAPVTPAAPAAPAAPVTPAAPATGNNIFDDIY